MTFTPGPPAVGVATEDTWVRCMGPSARQGRHEIWGSLGDLLIQASLGEGTGYGETSFVIVLPSAEDLNLSEEEVTEGQSAAFISSSHSCT